ncbi:MAG: hypothetical protein RL385_5024 [Pseudomonadota bacterium]|jgi:hypothetical protein
MMTMKISTRGSSLLAGLSVLLGAACGSTGSESAAADVQTIEGELAAATESATAASSVASDCFATYRTCKSAADADVAACRTALEACLPAEAPKPSCEGDAGTPSLPVAGDAGAPRVHAAGDAGMHTHAQDGGMMGGRPSVGKGVKDADAGVGSLTEDSDTDEATDEGGKGSKAGRGGRCEAPKLGAGKLGHCRDAATVAAAASTTTTMPTVESSHHKCMKDAFGDRIQQLCQKAEKLCADTTAPQDICTRITAACASSATTPTTVDAGA